MPASPTQSSHQSLIDALSGPNTETALASAMHQLERGADLPLVVAMVRALVQIGTPGLAVRLLRSSHRLLEDHREIAELVEQLSALPSGEVPMESLNERFHHNLQALAPRFPTAADRVADYRQPPTAIQLFQTSTGNRHFIRTSQDDTSFQWIFPFIDHRTQAANLQLPPLEIGTGFLLVGVPSPPLLNRLVHLEGVNGYRPPIDIVETSTEIFALWLRLIEDEQALRDERLAVFVGDDAWSQYEQFMLDRPTRVIASHTLTHTRPSQTPTLPDDHLNERLLQARRERDERAMQRQAERYAAITAEQWARRFHNAGRTEPALRIVGLTVRFSTVIRYAMRDLAEAFRRRGHTFDIYMEPNDCGDLLDFPTVLADGAYDLMVVINHLRAPNAHRMHPNIPYVCWIQDYMPELWSTSAGQSVGQCDLVLGHSRKMMCEVHDYPTDQFITTSNVTDAHTYSVEAVPEEDRAPHQCDVSFISHGSSPPEVLIEQIAGGPDQPFGRAFHGFLDRVRQHLADGGGVGSLDLLRFMLQAEKQAGVSIDPAERATKIFPAMLRVYDRFFRHQTVQWLAEWAEQRNRTLRLYGRGWDTQPRYAPFAAGEVQNGYPLRCVYQASKISIQANGYTSLHQRLLDGLASGCFMLSRYNPLDWHSVHRDRLCAAIAERKLCSMNALRAAAREDETLALELESFGRCFGCEVWGHNPETMKPLIEMGLEPFQGDNDSILFEILRTGGGIMPDRAAGHIDDFDQLVFRSRDDLHAMLDQYVDDADRRRERVEPVHRCVLANDTYDQVAGAIIAHFQNWFADLAGRSSSSSVD